MKRKVRILATTVLLSFWVVYASGRYPVSEHFDGDRFFNPWEPVEDKTLGDVIRWRMQGGRPAWPAWIESDIGKAHEPRDGRGVAATFVNHSTFVLRFAGESGATTVLTDPIWSERASPFGFVGPRRVHAPGVPFDSLPKVDVVVVSHNHYDHLDLPTLVALSERDDPLILVPLGDKALLESAGVRRVHEMDWWESIEVDGLTVTFLPAQHWSARGLRDRRKSLWGSFGITGPDGTTVYHGGDTGYGPHFNMIAERWGSPDLALLPIGAFQPRWFMRYYHMDPEDAVRAFQDLGAKKAVGMHFGTFQLADDYRDEPGALTEKMAGDLAFKVPAPAQGFFFP